VIQPTFELAQIIRENGISFIEKHNPLAYHRRVLNAIEKCRTSYFGGHIDKCDDCGHQRISYNSCRNRHCPKCQGTNRERWIMAREDDLLSTNYFHVVFTLPSELNPYCLKFPKELYTILFDCSKETMITFGRDPKHLGADIGFVSILHTWGQNLMLHPHVHMIVPGGGINENGYWKKAKSNGKFLFPVEAMSEVYRGKFMEKFKKFMEGKGYVLTIKMKETLYKKNWVVYAKDPFAGPKQVIEYLGRYSHKVAISNHRIKKVENGMVTFSYKDYADGNKQKLQTLEATEFLRRFTMHILPSGFFKIRHYGILSSRAKPKLKIQQMKMGILVVKKENRNWKRITKEKLGFDVEQCPCCKTGKMIRIMSFLANGPPTYHVMTHHISKNQ
jgi:hypothetical protein